MVNILVRLFSQEYLASWPTFFDELLALLSQGPPMVDLFLRICLTIDEEIVARYILRTDQEASLATQIVTLSALLVTFLKAKPPHTIMQKDKMREKDIERIVEVWYQVLATFYETHPDLVNLTLSCIGTYACEFPLSLRYIHSAKTFMLTPPFPLIFSQRGLRSP